MILALLVRAVNEFWFVCFLKPGWTKFGFGIILFYLNELEPISAFHL